MQAIPRCRNLLIVRNSLHFSSSTQFASFHSTPVCYDKRKNKSKYDFSGGPKESKEYARFVTRQKRRDAKTALRNLLYGNQGIPFENNKPWKNLGTISGDSHSTKKKQSKSKSKSESVRAEKIHNQRMRRKHRKKSPVADGDDYHETIFEANFGGQWYTWSFNLQNRNSRRSSPRFDWREAFRGPNGGQEEWTTAREVDDEASNVGLPSDRVMLGLSPKGPLKIKDVKTAFHLSALKWHPDKHQGPTQAAAEEKFKLCVNAYKSLCTALS